MVGKRLMPTVIRLALGVLFLYAGFIKIREPVAFAGSVAAYRLLPYFANYLIAAVLPWLEGLCGLLLICNVKVRGAATILFALNVVFIGALVSVIARGLNIDCGCFRQGGEATSPWVALARDIGIFGALYYLIRGRITARDSSRNGPQAPSP